MTRVCNHDHRGTAAADLRADAQSALEAAGEQWTEMRALVYETLAGYSTVASAYDIADRVSARRGKRVAPNSVYRILNLFVAANVAMRVESANAFIANAHPGCLHGCLFLVCEGCGLVTHADDDRLATGLRNAAWAAAFAPNRLVIEAIGRCAACGPA